MSERLCCLIHKTFVCIFCNDPFCVECWVACNKVYGKLDSSFNESICPSLDTKANGRHRRHITRSCDIEEEFRFAREWAAIMNSEKGKIKEFWNEEE